MAGSLKIVGVHGLGDHRNSPWQGDWEKAIRDNFPSSDIELQFAFVTYDDIFETVDLSTWQTMAAVGKLLSSAAGEMLGARKRGFMDDLSHSLRWYAGYVVAWVENPEFQKRTRKRIYDAIREHQPDILLAHSLGSLVSYNALTSDEFQRAQVERITKKMTYVSLGSQIGNPFVVRNLSQGRILPLDDRVRQWCHLYNRQDRVFTAPIRLPESPAFKQIDTPFDIAGFADHAAESYLSHAATVEQLWRPVALQATGVKTKALTRPSSLPRMRTNAPRRRALLVGINEYPDPAARLEGCVNDVFCMSSLLQECGFGAEQIRVCLNDRATAAGVRERLEWLVNDAQPGDELVFFYSGHGAQLPTYGEGDTVDQMDETLVPFDFDWTPDRAITDDQIFHLYSQLPYDTRLVMIFDCCHSGGIHRSGSCKARGLEPPDDIRHRAMEWDARRRMWVARRLTPVHNQFTNDKTVLRKYCGQDGCTNRLGRAMALRGMSQREYRRVQDNSSKAKQPIGPYLPLILEACQEGELASEYRNGNESYGAFTFCLASLLRQQGAISFGDLVKAVGEQLEATGYDQKPQILGPSKIVAAKVPWRGADSPVPRPTTKKPRRRKG